MAISPIGGITTYSSVASVQPMNYAIENGSEVSDVYAAETTKSSAVVNGTSPVQYPNATVGSSPVREAIDPLEIQRKKQETDNKYNEIAMKFMQDNPSYNARANAASYQMIGSKFDAYA